MYTTIKNNIIINNGKGSKVKLTKETNNKLGNNSGYWYNRIKNQYEAKTVVAPCKMM